MIRAIIWILIAGAVLSATVFLSLRANRTALRAYRRSRGHFDRFKLTDRTAVRESLLADSEVTKAIRAHANEHGLSTADTRRRVERYVGEIVPFFNIFTYYKIGLVVSRALLNLFYKVSAEHASENPRELARGSIVIYLMNHRSNADYVLVGHVLSGQVAISYAVGEWARVFPLDYIFKSFGAYFVRRRFREPLYHTVLERYVQLITRNGVTQGIFLEGGLSRDGRLGNAKLGLLDYILGAARDAAVMNRLYVIPVAINYDRVLEDRSLLRELDARKGKKPSPLHVQLAEVVGYVWWNLARIVTRRWKRYGRAALAIGEPVALAPWIQEQNAGAGGLFALDRTARLARVQALADLVLEKISDIIPVTPVPLACAAVQSFDADFIPHRLLLTRMAEMRDVLTELNARVIHREGPIDEVFDRAWRMLKMRRILVRTGDGYAVLPVNRPLVSYYANSIAHLLGPYADGVRARDRLPALAATAEDRTDSE